MSLEQAVYELEQNGVDVSDGTLMKICSLVPYAKRHEIIKAIELMISDSLSEKDKEMTADIIIELCRQGEI